MSDTPQAQPRVAEPPPQPQPPQPEQKRAQAARERAKLHGFTVTRPKGVPPKVVATGRKYHLSNKDGFVPVPGGETGTRHYWRLDQIEAHLTKLEAPQPAPDPLEVPAILARTNETAQPRTPEPQPQQPQPPPPEPESQPSPKAKRKAKAPKIPTKTKEEILAETISQSGAVKAAIKAADTISTLDAALERSDDFYDGMTQFAVAIAEVRKNTRLLKGLLQGKTKKPGNKTQPLVKAFFRGSTIDGSRVTRIAQCLEECQHQGVPPAETGKHIKTFQGGMRGLAEQYRTRKRWTSNTAEAEQERAEANDELIAKVTGLLGDPSIRLKPLPDYTTVFSASELRPEGSIRLFPVRIFPADGDRPNGAWEVFEALPLDETASLKLIQMKKKASEEKA